MTGIDALSGAPLAAQIKSAIVLTDSVTPPAAGAFVIGKMSASSVVTALGGEAVVTESQRNFGVGPVDSSQQTAINGQEIEK